MRLSKLLMPMLKQVPAEVRMVSHQLMLRAGMIRQVAKGIYTWLPIGQIILDNLIKIIDEEMGRSGAHKIIMPILQPVSLWKESGRYADGSEMSAETVVLKDRHAVDFLLSPTAEEMVTAIFAKDVKSYRQLPLNLYQITWKFRDEIRPRHGVMRAREFLMKDAYSFTIDEESAVKEYELMFETYCRIYKLMGVTALPVIASTGSMGGKYSHEFHVLAENGESTVFFDKELMALIKSDQDLDAATFAKFYAAEEEEHKEEELHGKEIISSKSIEVGHIFYLGQKYSQSLGAKVQDKDGHLVCPYMGCYGIGVSRLAAAIIEANHDSKGIIWPEAVAPYKIILVNLSYTSDEASKVCEQIYSIAHDIGIKLLYDDTDESIGAKLSKADLLGIPWQIIVGTKTIGEGVYEVKNRKTGATIKLSNEELLQFLEQRKE